MYKQSKRDIDPAIIKQINEEIRANHGRTIGLSRQEWKRTALQATVDWINSWNANWDLACCWHAGAPLRGAQEGWSADWLQRQLSAYFNKVRKEVFKDITKADRPNIARFITLEYTASVGWHAHGIMATPEHMAQDAFRQLLKTLWISHVGEGVSDDFQERLFWCDEIRGAYKHYALKSAIEWHGDNQTIKTAFIDDKNTYRP